MRKKEIITILFFIFSTSQTLLSQQDTIKIPPIQVFSSKITKPYLKTPSFNTNNFWTQLGSDIYFRDNNGIMSSLSFHGMKSAHTKVILWNIPVAPTLTGSIDLSLFPISLFDNINILDNFSSINSVSGALGGSLIINQEYIRKNGLNFSTLVNTNKRLMQNVKMNIVKNNIIFFCNAYIDYSDNFYKYFDSYTTKNPLKQMDNAEFGKSALTWGIGYKTNHYKLILRNLTTKSLRNFPPPLSYQGPPRQEYENNFYMLNNLSISYTKNKFSYSVSFAHQQLSSNYNISVAQDINIPMLHNYWRSESKYTQWKINYSQINLTITFDFQNFLFSQDLPEYTFFIVRRADKSFSLAIPLIKYKNLYINTISKIEGLNNNWYYLYDLSLKYLGKITVNIDLGKNINFPSMSSLYWQPGGNPHLKPEIAFQFIGDITKKIPLSHFIPYISINFGLRHAIVNNWILWKPSQYHYWIAENFGQVSNKGLNVKINMNINSKIIRTFSLSYSYTDVKDSLGYQIIYVPKHKFINKWTANLSNFIIDFSLIYESKRYVLTDNTNLFLKPYLLGNLSIKRKFDINNYKLNTSLNINNIFNTNYELIINRPQPLRYFSIILQLNLK